MAWVNGHCKQCGADIRYEVMPSRNHANRFCSRSCCSKYKFTGSGGPSHHLWKGGRNIDKDGYVLLNVPRRGNVQEHILVVERAIGHRLPAGAQVHHVNEVKSDNRPVNLVACQDQSYHAGLHERLRVRKAGGVPFKDRMCWKCQRPKPRDAFGSYAGRTRTACLECGRDMARARRLRASIKINQSGSTIQEAGV